MNKDKLVDLSKKIKIENTIDKNLYDKFSIKRGLRNKNGTGVLVGVTKVGDVCGYKIENGEKIPSKGELYYRGYPLTSMVEDFNNTKRLGFEEIIYLLLFNKLANKNDLESFKKILVEERNLPNKFFEDTILNLPGNYIFIIIRFYSQNYIIRIFHDFSVFHNRNFFILKKFQIRSPIR